METTFGNRQSSAYKPKTMPSYQRTRELELNERESQYDSIIFPDLIDI
jgi:hypothetical protein